MHVTERAPASRTRRDVRRAEREGSTVAWSVSSSSGSATVTDFATTLDGA